MAKFTLTFTDKDTDFDEVVDAIAEQNGLDVDDVVKLVHRFTDGANVTLQFDTETNKCWVLYSGKEGINDWKEKQDVVCKATNIRDKYNIGRDAYINTLQEQMDEALETYKSEEDKQSAASKNLLRFIEDTRQELNGLRNAKGGFKL